jgi:hypothetical protein
VDSLDHHLLNNLAAYLGSTLIIDPNPLNPLLTTNYLITEQYLEHPVETQSPIILALPMLRNNTTLRRILTATAHLPRLLILTSRQRAMKFVKRLPSNLTMTAPSGSITTIPKWFWYGTRRLLPMKNTLLEGISILLQNHPMSETYYDYLDAILSTRRTDSAPTTTMDVPTSKLPFDYFPETPSALMGDLFSPSTITRLAVLAGGISTVVRDKARQVLPQADIPSLLRDLRYTLIEHQY